MHCDDNGSTQATEGCCALPCTGTRATVLVTGDRTQGRFAIVEVIEHGGATHPLHVHSREDELVHVLEGRLRFYLDGTWMECGPGETLLLPRGSEHSHAVVSAATRLLVVLTPAGLEGYYRELGQPVAGPCVYQDAERLVVVAARYGIDIIGPTPPIPVELTWNTSMGPHLISWTTRAAPLRWTQGEPRHGKESMKTKGLAWAGIRTAEYDAMVRLFRDGLGLELAHEDHEFAGLMLPNGDKVEVFGLSDEEHTHFDSGPVVGFLVDDVAAARAQLEALAMVEFIGPVQSWPGGTVWQHFRAPDGNVYELVGPALDTDSDEAPASAGT